MKRSIVVLEEEPCPSSSPVVMLFSPSAGDTLQGVFLCAMLLSDIVMRSNPAAHQLFFLSDTGQVF